MSLSRNKKIGNVLNYIMGAVLIISGTLKLVGLEAYHNMIQELNPNYYDNIYLIGVIALLSGILFIVPKTFTYGFIASLVFLGGTISAHMQAGDIYIPQIVFVFLTGLVAYLKKPEWFRNEV